MNKRRERLPKSVKIAAAICGGLVLIAGLCFMLLLYAFASSNDTEWNDIPTVIYNSTDGKYALEIFEGSRFGDMFTTYVRLDCVKKGTGERKTIASTRYDFDKPNEENESEQYVFRENSPDSATVFVHTFTDYESFTFDWERAFTEKDYKPTVVMNDESAE
jgi:hypothetical protein